MLARKMIIGVTMIIFAFLATTIGANLVVDPDFESQPLGLLIPPALPWGTNYWHDPDGDGQNNPLDPCIVNTTIVVGGYDGNCVRMRRGEPDITHLATSQLFARGAIHAGVYKFSARFKTSKTHNGYINLHDHSWNDPNWNVPGGNSKPTQKGCTKLVQGTGDWHTITELVRVPEEDDYGQPASNRILAVWLYAQSPNGDICDVYYDNIFLEEFDANTIPHEYNEIEESSDWNIGCQKFEEGYPLAEADPNYMVGYVDANTDPNISGVKALVLRGTRTTKDTYEVNLPVKPSTKYKISAKVKYEDRNCYNYLDLNYPAYMRDPNKPTLKYTKGIWCGLYYINIGEYGTSLTGMGSLLPPLIIDSPYVSYEDRPWILEQQYFKTTPDAIELRIQVDLRGFDGKLYIDGLTVEEVTSHIEDEQLRVPIDYEFQGMKITAVDANSPPWVQTNAGKFIFDGNSIELRKDSNTVGKILFEEANFLSGLDVNKDINGLVLLVNNNITVSIGADSSMLVRLAKDINVTVTDEQSPKYYDFSGGTLFVSDYQKGMLFSPILPGLNIPVMPYVYNGNVKDYTYNDAALNKVGLKNWVTGPNFAETNWSVTYIFKDGDGFLACVFPPKDFNNSNYAKQRMETAAPNLNMSPNGDYSYFIQKFREHFSVMLLWQGGYNVSDNSTAPTVYYTKNGIPVSPNEPNATEVNFIHNDVAGPFVVKEPNALHRLVEQAHAQGIKVIVYMSPSYFYTTNVDTLLLNLKDNIDTYNIDGVYFDGYSHSGRFLKSIELVRKARNILKDKYYYQHSSWTTALVTETDHSRVPCLDAYADNIWLGEGVKKDLTGNPNFWDLSCTPDSNAWGLLYCNRNLSNTPSTLLAECRPVNWGDSEANSMAISLEPNEQIAYQLNYNGIFRTYLFSSTYQSSIYDSQFGKNIYFDSRQWLAPYDALCLSYTKGDGVADVGETIYSAPEDCAPDTNNAIVASYGDTYECWTDYSVAQWIIDGNKPFYRLHFTFNGELAKDDTDNAMNPYHYLGINNTTGNENYAPAEPCYIDGRNTFYFDGTKKLFGTHDESLCFTDDFNNTKDFSSFAAIKRSDSSTSRQYIFSLNSDTHFSYGVNNGRFFARVKNSAGTLQDYDSGKQIDQNWHTVGVVYDAEGQSGTLKLYVDGNVVTTSSVSLYKFSTFSTYTVGAGSSADLTSRYKGYIDDMFVIDKALTGEQAMQYQKTLHRTVTIADVNNVSCVVTDGVNRYTASSGSVINITKRKSYNSIQNAVDDASSNNEIVAYPATYYESVDFKGKNITVRSADPNDWDVVEATVINGNGATNTVLAHARLSGFTVTGGTHGIYCTSAGPASPVVSNCVITNNTHTGMKVTLCGATVKNCIIFYGGYEGIDVCSASLTVTNSIIYGNDTGIMFGNAGVTIRNCTIVKNNIYGVVKNQNGGATISNSIIWDNGDDLSGCSATYSCIKDCNDANGTGNICGEANNPCFVDVSNNDFHIGINSPCVNQGDPNGSYTGETDIDGQPRVIGRCVDIGADEVDFNAPQPNGHWWKLDEASGVMAYDSVGTANGTFNGNDPCWVTGHIGGAADFNGVSDYFSVSSLNTAYPSSSNFTVTGWFYTSKTTGMQTIVGIWSNYNPAPNINLYFGWQVLVENEKVLARFGQASSAISDITGTSDVNDGWHHFALVYPTSSQNAVLYVDGQSQGTPAQRPFVVGPTAFRIGDGSYVYVGTPPLKGGPFSGKIDDVMIYNRALTADEVEQLYLAGQ